jgi:hypothetical protein
MINFDQNLILNFVRSFEVNILAPTEINNVFMRFHQNFEQSKGGVR